MSDEPAARVTIPRPDDWHVHLRDGDLLDTVVATSASRFRYGLVMPNLVPPVVSSAQARAYRNRIVAAIPPDSPGFIPLMTLYCSSECALDDVAEGLRSGDVAAVKYYPAGATTNSDAGGTSMLDFMDLYEVLIEHDARLLVHAESTDNAVDIFDREAHFLETDLRAVCERLPELKVTVEHVSTAAGLDFIRSHDQVVGSITPHHLSRDRTDLLAHGMHADLYCKPVINSPADRVALVHAATSGDASFFLGTDSAPHPAASKYAPTAKAGVFNAAYGLQVVADVFWSAGALDHLAAFTSINGARVYGYAPSDETVTLTRVASSTDLGSGREPSPTLPTPDGDHLVHFGIEEAARWVVSIP